MSEFWFHHVGVSVIDLDAAIAWWGRMFGFQVERRYMLGSIPAEITVLRNGPLHIELFRVPEPLDKAPSRSDPDADVQTLGTKHIAFSVPDVGATVATLQARGADIVWVKSFPDGRAASFLRDNEGNLIELVQWPKAGPGEALLP